MKTIKILALMAIALPMAFISCSDDDDASSSPSSDSAIITTSDGDQMLLTSIKSGSYNYYRFDYDDEGRCTSVYGGCWDYDISYDPYKIVNDEDDDISFSFNGSGYVTKVTYSWSYKGSGWEESGKCTTNISYDGDHPTKITESYNGTEIEDGDKYTYSGSGTATLTWKNGNMTLMSVTWKESDSDGDNWTGKATYTYEYGNTPNECRQHTLALNEAYYEMDFTEDLGFIGYFGKGTSNLPTSYEETWEEEWDDGDEYNYSSPYSLSYTTNSDGTIKTEKINSTTYTYSYSTLASYTRSAVPTFEDAFSTPWNTDVERKHMFGSHSQRHSKHKTAEQQ